MPSLSGTWRGTISSLCHHCLSIRSWLSWVMSQAICSSVVHWMLHVHGEDVPPSLSSYSTWYISNILRKDALLDLWGHWRTGKMKDIAEESQQYVPVFSIITAGLEPLLSLPAETNDVREKKNTRIQEYKMTASADKSNQCHRFTWSEVTLWEVLCRMNIQYIYIYILWLLLSLFIVNLFCFALFYCTTIISTYGFHCTCKVTVRNDKNAVSCPM